MWRGWRGGHWDRRHDHGTTGRRVRGQGGRVRGEVRTALLVLISGRFRMEFPDRTVLLAEQGDYVVWSRGTDHSWLAEEDSVVLTVRWPSVPGYAAPRQDEGRQVWEPATGSEEPGSRGVRGSCGGVGRAT
ncbi:signal peptidase I [Streptomyces sp. NBC_00670]|uniref:signal peptidase I n=1 Tax=Streptomyces sp. NBC_00670 TaxID=2975804 RepID=UPI003FA6D11C